VKAGDEIVRLCNLAVLEAAVKAKDQRGWPIINKGGVRSVA